MQHEDPLYRTKMYFYGYLEIIIIIIIIIIIFFLIMQLYLHATLIT